MWTLIPCTASTGRSSRVSECAAAFDAAVRDQAGTKARIATEVPVKLTGISRSIASGHAPSGPAKKAGDASPDL